MRAAAAALTVALLSAAMCTAEEAERNPWAVSYLHTYGRGAVPQPLALVRHRIPPVVRPLEPTERPSNDTRPTRRFIFVAANQYTGTQFLTKLLGSAEGVVAFHERQPSVNGFPAVLTSGPNATYAQRRLDRVGCLLGDIANVPALSDPGTVYVDVNHMFIKSQADVLLDYLMRDPSCPFNARVDVVVLRRYLPHTVRSSTQQGSRGWPHTEAYRGGEYTLYHRLFARLPAPMKAVACESSASLAAGQFLDFEAQLSALKARFPTVAFHDARIELIQHDYHARALLGRLGLRPTNNTDTMGAWSTNRHASKLSKLLPAGVFEAVVNGVVARLKATGEALPKFPALDLVEACGDGGRKVCKVTDSVVVEAAACATPGGCPHPNVALATTSSFGVPTDVCKGY